MAEPKENLQMEKIVSLCKRRGFVFQSSEIYGGINGFWDYGPLGAELKRNLRDAWWHTMMRDREDCVGLDASIIMHRAVWKASGHEDTFSDPMSTCKSCKKLIRSDQVIQIYGEKDWVSAVLVNLGDAKAERDAQVKWAKTKGKSQAPNLALVQTPEAVADRLFQRITDKSFAP